MKRYNGKWICISFLYKSTSGKTDIHQIRTKEGTYLGDISWCSKWRKYAFHPEEGTVYEDICLREIAKFIERLMDERKK